MDKAAAQDLRNTNLRGPVIISRHGKPSLDYKAPPRLDWREYSNWWGRYEACSLFDGQTAPSALMEHVSDAAIVLSSVRLRAVETAMKAAPHMAPEQHAVFNEAPQPPPRFKRAKYLPKTWGILSRTAWLYGHALDGESVSEARLRAAAAAQHLHEASEAGKVYLAAHGWFNRMIRKEMKKIEWKCVYNGGDSYWSYRIYEYRGR